MLVTQEKYERELPVKNVWEVKVRYERGHIHTQRQRKNKKILAQCSNKNNAKLGNIMVETKIEAKP